MSDEKDKRLKQANKLISLMQEIQAIQERIVTVRYDEARSQDDVKRTIKNLTREVKRLEKDLQNERRKQVLEFEVSLKLKEIGLSSTYISKNLLHPEITSSPAPETREVVEKKQVEQENDTLNEEEMEDLKLMRTQSTSTLEGQTPGGKWKSLFRMYKEWDRETKIAKGQYLVETKGEQTYASIDEEVAQVRSAIFALKQKKQLPASEEQLLSSLQKRLKSLIDARKVLVNKEGK